MDSFELRFRGQEHRGHHAIEVQARARLPLEKAHELSLADALHSRGFEQRRSASYSLFHAASGCFCLSAQSRARRLRIDALAREERLGHVAFERC